MNERETDMMAAVADNEPQAQTEGVSLAGVLDGEPAIGEKEISEAMAILEKYKSAKASLDKRIIDNEEWYKLGHWKQYGNRMMEGKRAPSTGWLFNSIANKHADAMDNYPEPNVLPRAQDDEETAKLLSEILPVLLEQADYESVYSDTWWRKLKQGTGVKGIFWDPALRDGLGDIAIRSMDLLMLYWEPGVEDIQDSANFFSLALADNDRLTARWPQLEGKAGSSGITVGQYVSDQNIDTSEKSVVVDWYYKREKPGGQTVVHYCKFCNGVVLYASENDPAMAETGFYDHGKYPFVFDPLFVEENSPAGFGYIDVMKDTQDTIDRMTQAMDENTLAAAKKRYLISDTAGVNEDELLDTAKDVVHITGRLDERGFMELETAPLPSNTIAYQQNRVAELKEISGNRDVNQGGATSGLTAASAIAALQEAGSKLSRDMLKSSYRSFAKECYFIIDLMRQFYDESRVYRITGQQGGTEYREFSGQMLRPQPVESVGGVELGAHEPVFDITVSAAKKSTFSRLSQNETAKECYQLGFFAPANADAALACLDMMDFEGIEKVRQRVAQNGTLYQQLQQAMAQIQQMAAVIDQQGGTEYREFSGQMLRPQPVESVGGVELGAHEPVFDITVSAAKKSTFSRLSQNETAKECYQLGFFAPANADAALACLDMMDFEGIEKVRQRVAQNGTLYQQLQQAMAQIQQMAAVIDQQNGSNLSEQAGAAAAAMTGGGGGGEAGAKTVTNSLGGQVGGRTNPLATKAAERAMNINNPNK